MGDLGIPLRIEGRLEEQGFADLVGTLHRTRWSGTLTLAHKGIGKNVVFEDGRIVFASSSDPDDRLGELLLRRGRIRLRDLTELTREGGARKRLGAVLVERGLLTAAALAEAVKEQAVEIVYSLFQWTEGHYHLEEGPPPPETITLGILTPDVIFGGIRRIGEWRRVERGIGGVEAEYVRSPDGEDVVAQAKLSREELGILTSLDEARDVRTLCSGSSLPDFEVCRTLWALRTIGAVRLLSEEDLGLAPSLKRILAVGLEREVFDKVAPLLSRAVFAVERSPDAGSALSLCRRTRFDLVLVRHPLPATSLDQFLAALRKDGSLSTAAEVLFLTEDARLRQVNEQICDTRSVALPVTEPRKVLEEVACRLLGTAPRASARLVVKAAVLLEAGKRVVVHQTENVSEAGMLLRTPELYPLGTRLAFECALPGEKAPIQGEAEVVRHTLADLEAVHGLAVRFLGFKGDGRARLRDFVSVKRSAPPEGVQPGAPDPRL